MAVPLKKYDSILVHCEEDEEDAERVQNDLLNIRLEDGTFPRIKLEGYVRSEEVIRFQHLEKLKEKALFICILISKKTGQDTWHEYRELQLQLEKSNEVLPIILQPDCTIPFGFKNLNSINWTNIYKLEKFKNIVKDQRKRISS
ncbi:uncharacterized protein LOC115213022 [Argonauta hians]